MRVGIVVTDVSSLKHRDGSVMLARRAVERGHDVWITGVGDFAAEGWSTLRALAVEPPRARSRSTVDFLAGLLSASTDARWVDVASLDVLLLRSDAFEFDKPAPWAHRAAIRLGMLAARLGVLVLNEPVGLLEALDKTYVEQLPPHCRPQSLVTRERDAILGFVGDHGPSVVKPVEGAGGRNTFLLTAADAPNANQMLDVVVQGGYAVVQVYVPQAASGTLRLFFVEGRPLCVDGRYAALQNIPSRGDLRSNVSAGGRMGPAVIDEEVLRLAGEIGPIFGADGLFLVGVDIAGAKVLDVNATTPGGMWGAERYEGVDFATAVVAAVEERVARRTGGGRTAGPPVPATHHA